MATDETASTIAKALGESDELPVNQIKGVVRALGEETSQKLLEETLAIEGKGGMMLPDGSRKRTPGGVYFFLARQKLSQADKIAIFRPPKEPKAPSSQPPASESNRFPRRRVIEVAPARPVVPRNPRPGFVPPGLPVAVRKAKAREQILASVAGLPGDEQYAILVDVLAELHEKLGYRVPEGSAPSTFDPPTRPGAVAGPPSSQRPIPVPESSRLGLGESAGDRTGSDSDRPKRAGGRGKRS